MNKSELIDFIAKDAKITKAQAKEAVDSFMNHVAKSLKSQDRVTLVGFGTWSVVKKAARKGRNPKTQELINIPEKNAVKFKSSFDL